MAMRKEMSLGSLLLVVLIACQPSVTPTAASLPAAELAATPDLTLVSASQDIEIPDEGVAHAPEGDLIEYQNNPPASGMHFPVWPEYRLYEGQDMPAGYWVHILEHGAVVILYNCSEPCPDLVQSLEELLDSFPLSKWDNRKVSIVPYSDMDVALMAVAWNVQMPLDQFDADALIAFYERHVDRGPEDIP